MFGTATRVLIRWSRGLISVGGPGQEIYFEVSGIQDYEQAKKLGEDLLEAYKGQRGTTGVTGHVFDGSQQPGGGYYVGDRMDGQIIQSIQIGMDEEGQTVVTPELGDPLQRRLDMLHRRVAKVTGTQSEWASPFPPGKPQGENIDNTPPKFSYTWQHSPEAASS